MTAVRFDSFLDDAPTTRWLVLRAVAVVAAVLGLIGLVDWVAPGGLIINAGRPFKCEHRGGTIEIDLPETMQLRPGYYLTDVGWAAGLVVGDLVAPDGTRVGSAVFRNEVGDDVGALNAVAREYAGRHSRSSMSGRRWEARAARECGRRGLP